MQGPMGKVIMQYDRHWSSVKQFMSKKFQVLGWSLPVVLNKSRDSERFLIINRFPLYLLHGDPCSLIQLKLLSGSFNRSPGRFSLGLRGAGGDLGDIYAFTGGEQNIGSSQGESYAQSYSFKPKPNAVSTLIAACSCFFAGFAGFFLVYLGLWTAQFPKYHWWVTGGVLLIGLILCGCGINAGAYFLYVLTQ